MRPTEFQKAPPIPDSLEDLIEQRDRLSDNLQRIDLALNNRNLKLSMSAYDYDDYCARLQLAKIRLSEELRQVKRRLSSKRAHETPQLPPDEQVARARSKDERKRLHNERVDRALAVLVDIGGRDFVGRLVKRIKELHAEGNIPYTAEEQELLDMAQLVEVQT